MVDLADIHYYINRVLGNLEEAVCTMDSEGLSRAGAIKQFEEISAEMGLENWFDWSKIFDDYWYGDD